MHAMTSSKEKVGFVSDIKILCKNLKKIKNLKKKWQNPQRFKNKKNHYSTPWPKFTSIAEGVCKTSVLLVKFP